MSWAVLRRTQSQKKPDRDGSHGSGTVEDSSLQESTAAYKLRTKEIARGRKRDGGFHKLDNGRRLQAPEDEYEKRLDERADMGSRCWQRVGLK